MAQNDLLRPEGFGRIIIVMFDSLGRQSSTKKQLSPSWRGVGGSLLLTMGLMLALPLFITLCAAWFTEQDARADSREEFELLAQENERALLHRLNTYDYALLGAAGFIQGSEVVSRREWRTYVDTINIRDNFPGISGLGWVKVVRPTDEKTFLRNARVGVPDFNIHPRIADETRYIITYIEPEGLNRAALGLNIAFEKSRLEAAQRSRDLGTSAITGKIFLVQGQGDKPGFLLLHPVYDKNAPLSTVEERRRALLGWVYSPFVAASFLEGLTRSQGHMLNLKIYDRAEEKAENLIYDSNQDLSDKHRPAIVIKKNLKIMNRDWMFVWESTPAYEAQEKDVTPVLILVGGMVFTALVGIFLLILVTRDGRFLDWATGERHMFLPFFIFSLAAVLSLYLYMSLRQQEYANVRGVITEESRKLEQFLAFRVHEKLMALKRMGQRWEAAGGTPEASWRADARNYTEQLTGLRVVEWIDPTYHVRWAEPLAGNEKAIGLDIRFDEPRRKALEGAAEKKSITITPPLDLVQGYKAFIGYIPLYKGSTFDGFIAGIFSTESLLKDMIGEEMKANYAIRISYRGQQFFHNDATGTQGAGPWLVERPIQIHDKKWLLQIEPRRQFVRKQLTYMPVIVLVSGLLIGGLLSLTTRYVLIARSKSRKLNESNLLKEAILSSAVYLVIATDVNGRILLLNRQAATALGEDEKKIIGKIIPRRWLKSEELEERARVLTAELGEPVAADFDVFSKKPARRGIDVHEWTFVRRDGYEFPVRLSVTAIRDEDGMIVGFLGVGEDITLWKKQQEELREMDRLKSEFISIVSHELRTPLTSIRGSLGLVEGTMSGELPEKARHLISLAHKNCERLILLINDILDLDKIASGRMHFDIRPENLYGLLQQAIEANQAYADRYKVKLELQPVPVDLVIDADSVRFGQVMANLLSNAIKFSPEGGTVRIGVRAAGLHARVSVTDSGPGVPEAFRNRIFEKFSQADSSVTRQKGGTGLGLHISREMVTRMNGAIGFDSRAGVGSVFWVDMPLHADPQHIILFSRQDALRENIASILSDAQKTVPGILHIEDDEDFSRVLAAALQDRAQIVHARTLKEAHALLAQGRYDLIILDIGLPDGSGLTFLENMQELQAADIPVIILSATEVPPVVQDRVHAALVKSRVPEGRVVEIILSMLGRRGQESAHG